MFCTQLASSSRTEMAWREICLSAPRIVLLDHELPSDVNITFASWDSVIRIQANSLFLQVISWVPIEHVSDWSLSEGNVILKIGVDNEMIKFPAKDLEKATLIVNEISRLKGISGNIENLTSHSFVAFMPDYKVFVFLMILVVAVHAYTLSLSVLLLGSFTALCLFCAVGIEFSVREGWRRGVGYIIADYLMMRNTYLAALWIRLLMQRERFDIRLDVFLTHAYLDQRRIFDAKMALRNIVPEDSRLRVAARVANFEAILKRCEQEEDNCRGGEVVGIASMTSSTRM